jgi:membrane protease subunit HflK
LFLTGDQNMIEVNATVHYRLARPDEFLFRQLDGETTMRTAVESVLQSVITTTPLDDILTTRRRDIEQRTWGLLQDRLNKYGAGWRSLVRLLDVHPSPRWSMLSGMAGAFERRTG